jgi:hypothetical protein
VNFLPESANAASPRSGSAQSAKLACRCTDVTLHLGDVAIREQATAPMSQGHVTSLWRSMMV